MSSPELSLPHEIQDAEQLVLFLDYDGTLADFAPTPDTILPEQEVIRRVKALAAHPAVTVIVLSGRRLKHIQKLLPLERVWLAGSYGVEILTPENARLERLPFNDLRPVLDRLRPQWETLLRGRTGFFLEDKGWSLALHARFAESVEAEEVLEKASREATRAAMQGPFSILGGDRFLEIAPDLANKAITVEYFLAFSELKEALPVYLGDDDKDEAAFAIIQAHGGIAVRVGDHGPLPTVANYHLHDHLEARLWLDLLLESLPDPESLD